MRFDLITLVTVVCAGSATAGVVARQEAAGDAPSLGPKGIDLPSFPKGPGLGGKGLPGLPDPSDISEWPAPDRLRTSVSKATDQTWDRADAQIVGALSKGKGLKGKGLPDPAEISQ